MYVVKVPVYFFVNIFRKKGRKKKGARHLSISPQILYLLLLFLFFFFKYTCIWGNIHTDHSLCRLKIATKQCKITWIFKFDVVDFILYYFFSFYFPFVLLSSAIS